MATAQHLTDLAVGLTNEGHEVTVVASNRGYDNPSDRFSRRETWNGIEIIRIPSLALGKKNRWRRALSFASFLFNCAVRLLLLPKFDVVVALTSPPLISFLGALFVRLKGGQFFFWVMDLNPDQAIAAGWLKEDSLPARILDTLLRYSLHNAERVIALDGFMKQRIVAKGVAEHAVTVLPPWAHSDTVKFDQPGREEFRLKHNLQDSFVVMYAGNHSLCHPLDTLVAAAQRLAHHPRKIVFCFVGGGTEHRKVRDFARKHSVENILCLPYQPLLKLGATLSAADLHAVVMGDKFVGIVHPCKIYNILTVGQPFLYIGPRQSHVGEIASANPPGTMTRYRAYAARAGDVDAVVTSILEEAKRKSDRRQQGLPEIAKMFSKDALLPRMIKVLESQTPEDFELITQPERTRYQSAGR